METSINMSSEMFPKGEQKTTLLSAKKKGLRFTPAHPNWIIKAWKMLPSGMSLGVNNVKVSYYSPLYTVLLLLKTSMSNTVVPHLHGAF